MPVFIELTTDPFNALMGKAAYIAAGGARRPLRGIEVREDTYAYISLVRVDGTVINLLDSSDPEGESEAITNFLLQNVTDTRMERHQLIETFGDTYLFLFGEAPRMLQCSAILMNTHDFNWKAEFMKNYDLYLRGTKAIEKGCRTYLFYNDNIVEGYILNATTQEDVNSPHAVILQFQMFVTKAQSLAFIAPEFPLRSWVDYPEIDNSSRDMPIRSKISHNSDEYIYKYSIHDRENFAQDGQQSQRKLQELQQAGASNTHSELYNKLQNFFNSIGVSDSDAVKDFMKNVGEATEGENPDGVFLVDGVLAESWSIA